MQQGAAEQEVDLDQTLFAPTDLGCFDLVRSFFPLDPHCPRRTSEVLEEKLLESLLRQLMRTLSITTRAAAAVKERRTDTAPRIGCKLRASASASTTTQLGLAYRFACRPLHP